MLRQNTATTALPRRKRTILYWVGSLIVLGTLPLFLRDYYIYLASFVLITAISAMGLNIVTGFTGLFSFGQAGFGAVGAYTGVILVKHFSWLPFPVVLVIVCIVTAGAGILIGLPCLKLSGFYLAMATLAFAEGITELIDYFKPSTGGTEGMRVMAPHIGGFVLDSEKKLFFLIAVLTAFCLFITVNLTKMKIGRAWISIREDEVAAAVMGVNVRGYKLASFALGSMFGGLGGILYAYLLGYIRADFFSIGMALNFFVILLVGGIGNVFGPILGSIFIVLLPQILGKTFSQNMGLIYGFVLVIFIMLLPHGLIGVFQRISGRGQQVKKVDRLALVKRLGKLVRPSKRKNI